MKTLISIFLLCLLVSCKENKTSRIEFMIGTWKVENKEQYEVWEKTENKELIGYVYKFSNDQKEINETLSIKIIENKIIYEATVPDQNEGRTIPFTLNSDIKEFLSFENLEHDFPKKIQYKKINENEIKVIVIGDSNKGFSYTQLKQMVK